MTMPIDSISTHFGPIRYQSAFLRRRGQYSRPRSCAWLLDVKGACIDPGASFPTVTVESEGETYFGRMAVLKKNRDRNVDLFGMLWPAWAW